MLYSVLLEKYDCVQIIFYLMKYYFLIFSKYFYINF